jgi:UDP-2-acetamido-3-amino-2,3-dideoxy-glucuronate N-acetyltransferase
MIHKSAEVQSSNIGANTLIWQFTIVLKDAVIGNDCNINSHCFIENKVVIGNNVTVKCGVYLWDGITIHDNVFIGPNVTFINDKFPRSKRHSLSYEQTLVSRFASIGAGSTILCGVTVGEYSLIGAGSVITKNVPPYTLWYGNPARHMGYVTMDGEVLGMNMKAKDGTQYNLVDNKIVPA